MAGSPYAARFRRDLPLAAAATLPPGHSFLFRASTGARGWAAIPWLACFDPRITRSMKRGIYVACFIVPARAQIVLSLQLGAEDTLNRHGLAGGLRVLSAKASDLRDRIGRVPGMRAGPCDLGSTAPLPRGYQAGAIWHEIRDADRILPGILSARFRDLALRYGAWADAGILGDSGIC